ncbi:winged helix-turn-helix transcriptional regulator [Gluconobacter sphaericus]|uniref:Transcriptional regulator n=1 Tax=Gluconobacter sphaericus NBRC 12467 TaxID=1307951 RepID=A0AA37WB84_9PROT|nr:helix-turn-helix domain-containing protein [Gluconobacter sphaericus]GBR51601.1 MarR family transcriptional regulator [Gluconobacter sphaericus NBRC 12467]GEB43345.1 transcriptional regulator [Gluconobacter sphaericus NBRC 12467]GLQ85912.1 transcriptional regulator [Gluconobacter sphaericus NBRC 12467]
MDVRVSDTVSPLKPSAGPNTAPLDCSQNEDACAVIRSILARTTDKWSILIVKSLGRGPHRFSELRRAIDGISQRMLTLTLRNLERDGLVLRTVTPTTPPRVDYELTTLGESLWTLTEAFGQWALSNRPEIEAARARFDARLDADL